MIECLQAKMSEYLLLTDASIQRSFLDVQAYQKTLYDHAIQSRKEAADEHSSEFDRVNQ